MTDEEELRITIVRLTTFGLSVDDIEKALKKAGKELTKKSGDWTLKMNSYPIKEVED